MRDSPVALITMLITIGASLAGFFIPGFAEQNVFHPYSVARGRRLHTLITGNLIHAGFAHLIFNMFSFYFFAIPLERIVGGGSWLCIYLGSMLVANLPSLWRHRDDPDYRTVGASGAVSGCIFSMILFYPQLKMALLFFPVPIPAFIFGPLYLAYCYYSSRNVNDNINHDAHLWGALGGILITIIMIPESISIFVRSMGWSS